MQDTAHKIYNLLSAQTRKSGQSMYLFLCCFFFLSLSFFFFFFLFLKELILLINVFLDAKCLPDAEDWQKSFLYGLHHTKIIVLVVSGHGLQRMICFI
jgi:hypothetical protein